MNRDRFQTAGRLAEEAEADAPSTFRELLRPRTKAEIREREFQEVKGKREFGREVAEGMIVIALSRILWPQEYGQPTTLDADILIEMDDADIEAYAYKNRERLARFRDNLRQRIA